MQPLVLNKEKMGRVFFPPFLTHCRVTDRKGYLKWGKDSLLKECTQRSQELFCATPIVKVTAVKVTYKISYPYFIN